MPVTIAEAAKGRYSVRTPTGTKAKSTSLAKAKAQARLLNALDHGFKAKR